MSASRLIVLTDRAQLRLGRGLRRTIAECVDAGLRAVIVREHDLAPSARRALIATLTEIAGLTVISSRIPDPAAHGLHLAAHQACSAPFPAPGDSPDGAPEPGAPRDMTVGRSCHDAADVRRAAVAGASYATLSPFATSASKPGYGPPVPPEEYAGHPIPVYALGGVDHDNATRALAAGAHGVAVMGAVMRAADPAAVVADLLARIEREASR